VRPPPHVLEAFGAHEPEPLAGGEGTSWRCGDLVLKPVQTLSVEELEWQGRLFDAVRPDAVRTARLRGIHDGWCAWEYLEGEHRQRAWPEVIAAGQLFHEAISDVPRPALLDRRTDPWAVGDRVAWGELPAAEFEDVKHLTRLVDALRPVGGRSQLVHGDLTGNVLFADGLPPAVIDFSPYWRPPAYAAAIVIGDALSWEGADESLLGAVSHIEDFPQLLLRALVYRIVVDALFRAGRPSRSDADDLFSMPVELACSLAD
jgi:uncharacterized protein (TIGR02569 family)